MIGTLFDISDYSRKLTVAESIHLPEKNGTKWKGINESMSQNDCPNTRRRFQLFFCLSRHVLCLMVEFIIEMDSPLVK